MLHLVGQLLIENDRVTNEEVLHRVKDEWNILDKKGGRLSGLVTSCVGTTF